MKLLNVILYYVSLLASCHKKKLRLKSFIYFHKVDERFHSFVLRPLVLISSEDSSNYITSFNTGLRVHVPPIPALNSSTLKESGEMLSSSNETIQNENPHMHILGTGSLKNLERITRIFRLLDQIK